MGSEMCIRDSLWPLVTVGVDLVDRGTHDATLALDGATRALLRHFLSNALLVHTAVQHRPGDLTRVLALVEQRLWLRALEAEHLLLLAIVSAHGVRLPPSPRAQ